MRGSVIFFCLLVAVAAKRSSRIHYGRLITQAEVESTHQFVVNVLACGNSNGKCETCTGSVIDSKTILTAAHCFCGQKYTKVSRTYSDRIISIGYSVFIFRYTQKRSDLRKGCESAIRRDLRLTLSLIVLWTSGTQLSNTTSPSCILAAPHKALSQFPFAAKMSKVHFCFLDSVDFSFHWIKVWNYKSMSFPLPWGGLK